MLSPTQGIHQLRSAEKWAADKVGDARDRRNKRLKDATEAAQIEVARIRQERHRQFKEFEAKHMGSSEDVGAKIAIDTQATLEEMNKNIEKNQNQLIKDILNLMYDIKPVVHRNLKNMKEMHDVVQTV